MKISVLRMLLLAATGLLSSCVSTGGDDPPSGTIAIQVATVADAYPVTLTGLRLDTTSGESSGYAVLGELRNPSDKLEVPDVQGGAWRLCAVPAQGTSRERDGTLVATAVADFRRSDSPPWILLRDDSRSFRVQVVDDVGDPLTDIPVTADSEIIGLAACRSDAHGNCRLRVVGDGPFVIHAMTYGPQPRVSDFLIIEDVPDNVLRLEMRPVAAVTFECSRLEHARLTPVRLRFESVSDGQAKPVERDLTTDAAWALPTLLDLGDWRVQLLDKDGGVLSESRIRIAKPEAHIIHFEM